MLTTATAVPIVLRLFEHCYITIQIGHWLPVQSCSACSEIYIIEKSIIKTVASKATHAVILLNLLYCIL